MNIEKIMSKDLIVCNKSDSIYDVSKMMQKWDVGFLPVAENNHIVGVITDRDIIVNAVSNNARPDAKIEKYITKNIISIDKNKKAEEAITLMGEEKIKRLIVTEDDKVVGILSLSDIINNDIDNKLVIENMKKIWEINRNIDEYQTEIDDFYL